MSGPVNLNGPSYLPALLGSRLPGDSLLARFNANRSAANPVRPANTAQDNATAAGSGTRAPKATEGQSLNILV